MFFPQFLVLCFFGGVFFCFLPFPGEVILFLRHLVSAVAGFAPEEAKHEKKQKKTCQNLLENG